MNAVETRVRRAVSEKCARGKVEVAVRLQSAGVLPAAVNKDAAFSYTAIFKTLAEMLGTDEKIAVRDLIRLEGVLQAHDHVCSMDEAWEMIEEPLQSALAQFDRERQREGENTQKEVLVFLGNLENSVRIIKTLQPQEESRLKESTGKKFAEIAQNITLDDSRLLAETTLLVMKYTISEELARLDSHLSAFHAEITRNEKPGKSLDFLCQEINREVNTIGSKSPSIEVIRQVVAMKENLENIREQLRNVE
jgi:uncharacterized protein (TIGR00255 family)